jgi:hypothetical protein
MFSPRTWLFPFALSLLFALASANPAFAAGSDDTSGEPPLEIHYTPSYNRVQVWLQMPGESHFADARVHEVVVLPDGKIVLRGARVTQVAARGRPTFKDFAITYLDNRNPEKSVEVFNAAVRAHSFLRLSWQDIQRLRIAAKNSGTDLVDGAYHFTAETRESHEGFGMFGLQPNLFARFTEQRQSTLKRLGTVSDARILSVRIQRSGEIIVKLRAQFFTNGSAGASSPSVEFEKDLEFKLPSLAEYNQLQSEPRLQIDPEVVRDQAGLFSFDRNQVDYRLYSPVVVSASLAKCRKVLN